MSGRLLDKQASQPGRPSINTTSKTRNQYRSEPTDPCHPGTDPTKSMNPVTNYYSEGTEK